MSTDWASAIAAKVRHVMRTEDSTFITCDELAEHYHYSPEQAAHVLNRAAEYGAVERFTLDRDARNVYRRRYGYRPA